jgi:hypothetical protein
MSPERERASEVGLVALVPSPATEGVRAFDVVRGRRRVGWIRFTPETTALRMTGEVGAEFRDAGVATAAVRLACRLIETDTGDGAARTLEALVPADAGAAQHVLEANGFVCADVTSDPLSFARALVDGTPATR